MKRYGIKSCKVTMMWMYRLNVITKAKAKQASKGKLENDADWRAEKIPSMMIWKIFSTIFRIQKKEKLKELPVSSLQN